MASQPPTILLAAGISCGSCEHGSVHVEFHDKDGVVFAAASMGEAQAARFLLLFTASCEAILDGQSPEAVAAAPVGLH